MWNFICSWPKLSLTPSSEAAAPALIKLNTNPIFNWRFISEIVSHTKFLIRIEKRWGKINVVHHFPALRAVYHIRIYIQATIPVRAVNQSRQKIKQKGILLKPACDYPQLPCTRQITSATDNSNPKRIGPPSNKTNHSQSILQKLIFTSPINILYLKISIAAKILSSFNNFQ